MHTQTRRGGIAAFLLLTLLGLTGCSAEAAQPMDTTVTVETQTVSTGALALEETYVASVETEGNAQVYPKVAGVVTEVRVAAGDTVQAGDVLCRFEDSGSAGISVSQTRLNYQQLLDGKYPEAAISGTVSHVYVKDGDSISAGSPLVRIVASSDILADFTFTYAAPGSFYVGQSATVFINGFEGSVPGTVEAVSSSTATLSGGQQGCTVRVRIPNPGSLTDNASYTAQAVIGSYSSARNATLSLSGANTVYATASGTVAGCTLMTGDTVTAGQRICTIDSDALDTQIANAALSVQSASNAAGNYTLTAPISGIVETVNVTANNSASSAQPAFVISSGDTSKTATFYVTDAVAQVLTQGQPVTVADQGAVYEGNVSEIGLAVDAATGLFQVKAVLKDAQALPNGKTVSLTTAGRQVSGQVVIPTDALYFDAGAAYVYVVRDGIAVRTDVTLDIYTQTEATVASGLTPGDELIVTWSSGLRDGAPVRYAGDEGAQEAVQG